MTGQFLSVGGIPLMCYPDNLSKVCISHVLYRIRRAAMADDTPAPLCAEKQAITSRQVFDRSYTVKKRS